MMHTRPVALVTGAASGIGRSTALRLAQQRYDVVINYSSSEAKARITARDVEALGASSLIFQADVSNGQAVRDMFAAVQEHFGRLDALINNAGTTVLTPPTDLEGPSRSTP